MKYNGPSAGIEFNGITPLWTVSEDRVKGGDVYRESYRSNKMSCTRKWRPSFLPHGYRGDCLQASVFFNRPKKYSMQIASPSGWPSQQGERPVKFDFVHNGPTFSRWCRLLWQSVTECRLHSTQPAEISCDVYREGKRWRSRFHGGFVGHTNCFN